MIFVSRKEWSGHIAEVMFAAPETDGVSTPAL